MNQDVEHLRLLSIFHYLVAGLAALFALLPVMHLVMGIVILTGGFDASPGAQPAPPGAPFERTMGWILIAFASVAILCGLAYAALLVAGGRALAAHRRHLFCLVVAGLACLLVPFGTVLGVFTIVVLQRPSVRALFGVDSPIHGEAPPPA